MSGIVLTQVGKLKLEKAKVAKRLRSQASVYDFINDRGIFASRLRTSAPEDGADVTNIVTSVTVVGKIHRQESVNRTHIEFLFRKLGVNLNKEDWEFADENIHHNSKPSIAEPLIVKRGSDKYYQTIGAALERAKPDDVIQVHPGFYKEELVINKSVEITGLEGKAKETIVQGTSGSAVTFLAAFGKIANLSLYQASYQHSDEAHHCIDVETGTIVIENCDIRSDSLSGICIYNDANSIIRHNHIHDCSAMGVLFAGSEDRQIGHCLFEDNIVQRNKHSGIGIERGANPTILNNKIQHGLAGGIHVFNNGRGEIEDNDIAFNAFSGVVIENSSNPQVIKNNIHHNREFNLSIVKGGSGHLKNNHVHDGQAGEIDISEQSEPTIEDNEIHNSGGDAVLIRNGGLGKLRNNHIHSSIYCGMIIRDEGSRPEVTGNSIYHNAREAIRVYDGGGGVFIGNHLKNNLGGAWYVDESSIGSIIRLNNDPND